MSHFEHELLDVLDQDAKFDPARAEVLRLQITSQIKHKKKRLLIWAWIFQAVFAAMIWFGVTWTFDNDTGELRYTIQGVALIILGESGLIVIKLWYWIVHTRLEIMRELKRFELRWTLAQARDNPPAEPTHL